MALHGRLGWAAAVSSSATGGIFPGRSRRPIAGGITSRSGRH